MTLSLVLDGVLILLLVASIAYCAMLHRRLGVLRSAQGEMQEMIRTFSQATQRAESGIAGLRAVGDEVNRLIEPRLEETRVLRDDLQLLVERGERAAERLEQGVAATRKAPPDAAAPDESTDTPDSASGKSDAAAGASRPVQGRPAKRSQREVELINALKAIGR